MKKDLLLSIQPHWAKMIYERKKQFEYRRVAPVHPIQRVYIYETESVKKITGSFLCLKILSGSPQWLWQEVQWANDIKESTFFDYFDGCKTAHAIRILSPFAFSDPLTLRDLHLKHPPQNFFYLDQRITNAY